MKRSRSTVVALSRSPDVAWWWQHVDWTSLDCTVTYRPIVMPTGRPIQLWSAAFFRVLWDTTKALFDARRLGQRYLFTFECDWSTWVIAALQTLLFMQEPRHVVLQFIMRERTERWPSRLKYVLMRVCFRSIHRVVCSARAECDYYADSFGWPASKLLFVPFHTDPAFLQRTGTPSGEFALSAGRSFRDYKTLVEAFDGLDVPLEVVASRAAMPAGPLPPNVSVQYDIPGDRLAAKIAEAMIIVIPLEERRISIGQSVLLEAMAMGKAVIVTRVAGTQDYVEDMVNGVLVPPRDAAAIRHAVERLTGDPILRERLGRAARDRVVDLHLPDQYVRTLSQVLAKVPAHE